MYSDSVLSSDAVHELIYCAINCVAERVSDGINTDEKGFVAILVRILVEMCSNVRI